MVNVLQNSGKLKSLVVRDPVGNGQRGRAWNSRWRRGSIGVTTFSTVPIRYGIFRGGGSGGYVGGFVVIFVQEGKDVEPVLHGVLFRRRRRLRRFLNYFVG